MKGLNITLRTGSKKAIINQKNMLSLSCFLIAPICDSATHTCETNNIKCFLTTT